MRQSLVANLLHGGGYFSCFLETKNIRRWLKTTTNSLPKKIASQFSSKITRFCACRTGFDPHFFPPLQFFWGEWDGKIISSRTVKRRREGWQINRRSKSFLLKRKEESIIGTAAAGWRWRRKNDRSNSTLFLMMMLCNLCSVLANTQKCLRDVAQCRAIIRRFFLFGFPSNLKKIMLHICVVRVCRSVRWFSFQNPEFVKLLLSLNFSYRLDWKTFKRNFPFGQWFGAFIQRKQS